LSRRFCCSIDEPFGAPDVKVRKELRRWLRRPRDELRVTTVLLTHVQDEALEVSDRVTVRNHRRIEQAEAPREVYANPASPFAAEFLADVNLFRGRAAIQKPTRRGSVRVYEILVKVNKN
jgi:sulfate transport system ATP-binding protein